MEHVKSNHLVQKVRRRAQASHSSERGDSAIEAVIPLKLQTALPLPSRVVVASGLEVSLQRRYDFALGRVERDREHGVLSRDTTG